MGWPESCCMCALPRGLLRASAVLHSPAAWLPDSPRPCILPPAAPCSEQQPAVEGRLAEVGARLEAPAGSAAEALGALRDEIEGVHSASLDQPPLAELEAALAAAVAQLGSGLGEADFGELVSAVHVLLCCVTERMLRAVCSLMHGL